MCRKITMTEAATNVLAYIRGIDAISAEQIADSFQRRHDLGLAVPRLSQAEVEAALEQLAGAGWVRRLPGAKDEPTLWEYVPEVPAIQVAKVEEKQAVLF